MGTQLAADMRLAARAGAVVFVVAAFGLSTLDCGARTALTEPDLGGAGGAGGAGSAMSTLAFLADTSSSGAPCHSDAECDDKVDCTVDTCQGGVCSHAPDDGQCDDGIRCTKDTCDPGFGCQNDASNDFCDDGIACTVDVCDLATDSCVHEPCDSMCDDGVFCNGVERCDAALGCVEPVAAACVLDACANHDVCVESSQTCVVAPDDPSTCKSDVHLVVAEDDGSLTRLDPYLGTVKPIAGPAGTTHVDVAILGGRWFAMNPSSLIELAPGTNDVIRSFSVPYMNSLGAGPDGMLYGADFNVYRLDPDAGDAKLIGVLPGGYESSGDIAFFQGQMYISVDGPCSGALVSFDPQTAEVDLIGGDGLGCVYGLAATDTTLFLLNCDGKIGTFDPLSGTARVISTTSLRVYGADILP